MHTIHSLSRRAAISILSALFVLALRTAAIAEAGFAYLVLEDNAVHKLPVTDGLTLRAAIVRTKIVSLHAYGVLLAGNTRVQFTDKKLTDTHLVGKTILHPGDIIVFGDLDAAREQVVRAAVANQ